MCEGNIDSLPLASPELGTWSATLSCTKDQTSHLSVCVAHWAYQPGRTSSSWVFLLSALESLAFYALLGSLCSSICILLFDWTDLKFSVFFYFNSLFWHNFRLKIPKIVQSFCTHLIHIPHVSILPHFLCYFSLCVHMLCVCVHRVRQRGLQFWVCETEFICSWVIVD